MNAHTAMSSSRYAWMATRRPVGAAQRGATLLEILVSMLIFSLGVLGLVAMLAKAMNSSVDAKDRTRAAVLADELVTAMLLEGTASPSILSNWKTRAADATVSGLPNASVSDPISSSTDTTTGIVTYTITLSWTEPSKDASNSYYTKVVLP